MVLIVLILAIAYSIAVFWITPVPFDMSVRSTSRPRSDCRQRDGLSVRTTARRGLRLQPGEKIAQPWGENITKHAS